MKKITIFILVVGLLIGASFLKVFTVTTTELVITGARDCFENCPPGFDTAITNFQEVNRKGNFWEKVLN